MSPRPASAHPAEEATTEDAPPLVVRHFVHMLHQLEGNLCQFKASTSAALAAETCSAGHLEFFDPQCKAWWTGVPLVLRVHCFMFVLLVLFVLNVFLTLHPLGHNENIGLRLLVCRMDGRAEQSYLHLPASFLPDECLRNECVCVRVYKTVYVPVCVRVCACVQNCVCANLCVCVYL